MQLSAAIEVYSGGPGSGCRGANCGRPTTVLYHGTTSKKAKSILRSGLRRNYPKNFDISSKGYVYVSTSRQNAKQYAVTVGGWRGALLALELPTSFVKKNFERDPEKKGPFGSSNKLALRFAGDIPKSAIKWVEYRQAHEAGWQAKRVVIRAADEDEEDGGSVLLYVPYFGDLGEFGIRR